MSVEPVVIVGSATQWAGSYRGFAEVVGEVSGAEVHVVPLTPFDWAAGYVRGFGQLVFEVAGAVDRALLDSEAKKVVLVGHSAGGLASRVYIGGEPPYGGRRYSGHRRVSALITLGTPHATPPEGRLKAPISRINELFPGALHKDSGLRYLSVAGDAVDGSSSGRARRRYEGFIEDGRTAGDGVVPVESALLPGSETMVLEGLFHNRRLGPWYGSDREAVERWWPEALRVGSSLVGEEGA